MKYDIKDCARKVKSLEIWRYFIAGLALGIGFRVIGLLEVLMLRFIY